MLKGARVGAEKFCKRGKFFVRKALCYDSYLFEMGI